MSGFSDASMAVDDARRYSRTIGFKRCDSVYGDARQLRVEQLSDPLLVLGVDDRPEEADADGLDLELAQAADHRQRLVLVERHERLPLRGHPLADLERQASRDIRLRVADPEVERIRSFPPSLRTSVSGKPSVVRKAVRAVPPVRIAFVAAVVP